MFGSHRPHQKMAFSLIWSIYHLRVKFKKLLVLSPGNSTWVQKKIMLKFPKALNFWHEGSSRLEKEGARKTKWSETAELHQSNKRFSVSSEGGIIKLSLFDQQGVSFRLPMLKNKHQDHSNLSIKLSIMLFGRTKLFKEIRFSSHSLLSAIFFDTEFWLTVHPVCEFNKKHSRHDQKM